MSFNVLLCSPVGMTGGIAHWTEAILMRHSIESGNLVVTQFYPRVVSDKVPETLSLYGRVKRGVLLYIPFLKGLKKKLRTGRFDVIHLCTSGGFSLLRDYLAIRLVKKHGGKAILHLHFGRVPDIYKRGGFEKFLMRKCTRIADKVVVLDKLTLESIQNDNVENVCLLPNPLPSRIKDLADNIERNREANLVVFVGHVLITKGILELVEACVRIKGVDLEIYGLCSEDISAKIKQIGCERDSGDWIKIMGNCDNATVISALKRCAVFALPSYTEGFPNVILESMACGAPIVATKVGAIPDMLRVEDGDCGVLVEPKDIESLTDAIRSLLCSPEKRRELGISANIKVNSDYSIDSVWDKLKSIWTS